MIKNRKNFNILKCYNSIQSGNLNYKLTSYRRQCSFNEWLDGILLHQVPDFTGCLNIRIGLEEVKLILSFIVTEIINCWISEWYYSLLNSWIYRGSASTSHAYCNSTCKVQLRIYELLLCPQIHYFLNIMNFLPSWII